MMKIQVDVDIHEDDILGSVVFNNREVKFYQALHTQIHALKHTHTVMNYLQDTDELSESF